MEEFKWTDYARQVARKTYDSGVHHYESLDAALDAAAKAQNIDGMIATVIAWTKAECATEGCTPRFGYRNKKGDDIVEAAKDMNRYEQGLFASEPMKQKRVWVSIFARAYDDLIGVANDGTAWRTRGPTKPGTEQWVQIKSAAVMTGDITALMNCLGVAAVVLAVAIAYRIIRCSN